MFRAGRLWPGSALDSCDLSKVTAKKLLGLADKEALAQLAELRKIIERNLIPQLAARRGKWFIGPTFSGSALIAADGDLLAKGLLLDLKVRVGGQQRKDGTRQDQLKKEDIYQLVAYALLDFDDKLKIRELGIFNARYGHLATWPLQELLNELAGKDMNLMTVRRQLRTLLKQPYRVYEQAAESSHSCDCPICVLRNTSEDNVDGLGFLGLHNPDAVEEYLASHGEMFESSSD